MLQNVTQLWKPQNLSLQHRYMQQNITLMEATKTITSKSIHAAEHHSSKSHKTYHFNIDTCSRTFMEATKLYHFNISTYSWTSHSSGSHKTVSLRHQYIQQNNVTFMEATKPYHFDIDTCSRTTLHSWKPQNHITLTPVHTVEQCHHSSGNHKIYHFSTSLHAAAHLFIFNLISCDRKWTKFI